MEQTCIFTSYFTGLSLLPAGTQKIVGNLEKILVNYVPSFSYISFTVTADKLTLRLHKKEGSH